VKLKVFTFRFSEGSDGFDDGLMQAFIEEREVIEFTDHFFIHEKTPYLTVIISYRDISPDERRKPYKRQDPRKDLDENEQKTYDALRAWRAAKASQEGVPPYMIANNRQIAGMVKSRAKSKADLGNVKGIGEGKIVKYGEDILRVISENLIDDSDDTREKEEGAET